MGKNKEKIKTLEEKRRELLMMGGEGRIEKQHQKGKLSARERLDLLMDEGYLVYQENVGLVATEKLGRLLGGGPTQEDVDAEMKACNWRDTGMIADYVAADDPPWTSGSLPQATRCYPEYRGNTATCWDGASVDHPGRSGIAWCTYKHVSKTAYHEGGNAGKVYECVCR